MPVEALTADPTFEPGPDVLIRRLAGRTSYTDTAVPDDPAGEPHPLTGTGFAGTTGTASQYGNQMIRDWARSNREGNTS